MFCGSGTMLVAVLACGRNVISIDYNQIATGTTKARYSQLVDFVKSGKALELAKL